ncbi:hypothetical protein SELMODRAFT_410382 [Selaginella moellendorffii]|uniref:Uncharacterized protein n=1 Tax=Selaginella moellendorffii TaxID=88036 RepID=D8REK4_SELML|nr:hypothetical protein SELMODRAFT_410382 [Selaginella moellendorffii]
MSGCYLDEDHEKKIKALGLSWSSKNDAWPEEASLKGYPSHPRASEFVAKFSCEDEVLGIGDVFYSDVESELVAQIGGPLQHSCKTIIRLNRLILLTVQSNVKNESCFFPIPQAASCISRKIQEAKPRVIYISTDAAESEITLLQQLLGPDVVAMLDKTICAMAESFIGTPGSTFTDDIVRLRKEWGSSNSCDGVLCQGQYPNFIADTGRALDLARRGGNITIVCERDTSAFLFPVRYFPPVEQVAKAFKEHKETFLRLDVCVNCAGIVEERDFVSDDKWCKVLRIQAMRSQDSPGVAILNLASTGGLFLVLLYPIYSASKGGLGSQGRLWNYRAKAYEQTFCIPGIISELLLIQYVETPMTAKEMIAATIPMKNPVYKFLLICHSILALIELVFMFLLC